MRQHPETIASAGVKLRTGAVTSVELVESSLAAIAHHSARTHAFITVDAEGARRRALEMDREGGRGIDRGPLHGIPISIKDIIDVAGVVTTAGSRVMEDRVAEADAPIVTRLAEAGAVIIGRTNLHEFALGPTSEDSAFGPVLHPTDETRLAGGSSGGAAVAVVTGMGLAAVGTDTGGSVRMPATACGAVGLKPTFGEIPVEGVIPLSATLDHIGPLARTVQDAAWLFAVLAGREPWPVEAPAPDSLRLVRLTGYFETPLDPVVRAAYERAIARLSAAGVRIGPAEIPNAHTTPEVYTNVALPEAAAWHARYLDTRADRYTAPVRSRLEFGRTIPEERYRQALAACVPLRQAVTSALGDADALVLPTLPITAPRLGPADVDVDGTMLPVRPTMLKLTQLFNVTGHPAITIPIPGDGLPIGLQLVGHLGQTERLLAVALACESILAR